jgi:uncharacterized protein YndB with AHSA1/START domain
MKNNVIKKTITIQALPQKVWQVFTDPVVSRQMGGEYVTDWKTGSTIGWKGIAGTLYTNGIILQIEPGKLLKHNLLDLATHRLLSVITYELIAGDGFTSVHATEELNGEMTDEEYKGSSDGWDMALQSVKNIAEKE